MNCKTLVILNNKGGVGKTTTACTVMDYFYKVKKLRVLGVDLDSQLNLTQAFIGKVVDGSDYGKAPMHPDIDVNDPDDAATFNNPSTINDIFYGKEVLPYDTEFSSPDGPTIDIIPCSPSLMQILSEVRTIPSVPYEEDAAGRRTGTLGMPTKSMIKNIASFVGSEAIGETYDVVVVDCGPKMDGVYFAALQAATHVVTPYVPEALSSSGISAVRSSIVQANQNRVGRTEIIKHIGVFPSLVDLRTGMHSAIIEAARKSIGDLHMSEDAFLGRSVRYLERTTQNRPEKAPTVFDLPKNSNQRVRAEAVCSEIAEKMGL